MPATRSSGAAQLAWISVPGCPRSRANRSASAKSCSPSSPPPSCGWITTRSQTTAWFSAMSIVAASPASRPSGSAATRSSAPGSANHCSTSARSVLFTAHMACPCAFSSSTAASTSSSRGGRISGIAQHLLPDDNLVEHAHPGPLVEPGCAGRALGVDLQRNPALAAVEKRAERALQQRLGDAPPPPGGPHAEQVDPAPLTVSLPVAEGHAGELVSLGGNEVQRRIVTGAAERPPAEVGERPRRVHPATDRPRLLQGRVDRPLLRRPKRPYRDARGRGGRRRRLVEVDHHPPGVAYLSI